MAWLVRDNGDNELPTRTAGNNKKPEFSMSEKVGAKLATADSLKAAMANFEPLKAANENSDPKLSMSGKVEVASSESRLEALRRALANHNEISDAPDALAEVVESNDKDVREEVAVEEIPAAVAAKPEEKATVPTYANFSGLDIYNLPQKAADAITALNEINDLQAKFKVEMVDLRERTEGLGWINDKLKENPYIHNPWVSEYSQEFIKINNNKGSEIKAKAKSLTEEAESSVGHLRETASVLGPEELKVVGIISEIRARTERDLLPGNFNRPVGWKFFAANEQTDPVRAIISSMKPPQAANENKPRKETLAKAA